MPTYEYLCSHCSHAFEEFQSITAKPLRKCPQCDKLKLKRLIGTGAGVIFKGSGFWQTDYRSDGYKKDAKADKESNTTQSDSDTKKSASADKSSSDSSTAANPTPKPKASDTKKSSKSKKSDP